MATVILTSNTIAENVRGQVRIGTLSIQERPGEAFTFALVNDFFEILSREESGSIVYDLYVKSNVAFDFEATPQFSLRPTVTDSAGNASWSIPWSSRSPM
jgi:hypothetical protein